MRLLFAACIAALGFSTAASAATLVNGSLTGPEGQGIVPTGWSINSNTPDTTSVVSQTLSFNVNVGSSPDGGTMVALARNTFVAESFGQTINDFVVGQTYELSWYAANPGCCNGGFSAAAEIIASVGGVVAHTGQTLAQGQGWVQDSFTFVAAATSLRLDFGLAFGTRAYMVMDGVSLTRVEEVPLPVPGLLLMAGMGSFAALRRKRKN